MDKSKMRAVLTIGGIVVGIGIFSGLIYWQYVKRYDKSHPETLSDEELVEMARTTVTEHKIVPKSMDKPALESLVRDRSDRIDYASISSNYSNGERITTETTHIVKDARGTDKGRDLIDDDDANGLAGGELPAGDDGPDTEWDISDRRGDPKARLLDPEDDEIVSVEEFASLDPMDRNEVVKIERQVRSNAAFGRSQAELAMRFKVIDETEFFGAHEYYDNKKVTYFAKDQLIAGFDDSLVEIADDDLLAIAYTLLTVKGLPEGYVRDTDAGVDYHIVKRGDSYDAAFEEWVLSNSDDE